MTLSHRIASAALLISLVTPIAARADQNFWSQAKQAGAQTSTGAAQGTDFKSYFETPEVVTPVFDGPSEAGGLSGLTKARVAATVIRCPDGQVPNSTGDVCITVDITGGEPTPEPATMSLMALGLAGLAGARRRRNRRNA